MGKKPPPTEEGDESKVKCVPVGPPTQKDTSPSKGAVKQDQERAQEVGKRELAADS